ncbi:SWIM zinc finger family protein [Streptomyces sp. NRRL F-2664]|uniref:SWIM zinc finger family protein n=1 Tax=Streptomyces sp. NRRL F-2664 TaxID=1463842 RepID=UPI0004CA3FBE|nr:SWIM zinc finger family protein [Streptomyces sp. NRRL F-2664]
MSTVLPPVAPEVLAEAVGNLTARLRKKLDDATAACADTGTPESDGTFSFRFGEDAVVTLRPGPAGTVTEAGQATCTCLLAPRCLHRAAALGAAPLADAPPADPAPEQGPAEPVAAPTDQEAVSGGSAESAGSNAPAGSNEWAAPADPVPTAAQLGAAAALWQAAAEALAAGVTAGGAVVQAELLRAAHTARLAGLPRAEAAALRVVRGLRAARERRTAHRLGDLTGSFRELLHTAGMLAAGTADPALSGTSRRAYTPGGSLQVYGLCREPVLSATGYGGVVTHLLAPDGSRYSISDVRPGGLARARGAGRASVALGGATLDHAGLARGGLRIVGATVSAEGRLGAGRGVKATPLPGAPWTDGPGAALFARPAAEAVAELLAQPAGTAEIETALIGCDVTVVGAAGDHVLVREARPDGPLLRLLPAHPHPELPHTENLRRIASYPGLRMRVLGRPDLGRAATLRPVAVGPVPGAPYTLRLPAQWTGRADLGYDRLQGEHFPQPDAAPPGPVPAGDAPDPLADAPLWRVRRLLETGVAGGRRAVAEAARGTAPLVAYGPLRRAGLTAAADLAAALAAEADRRPRDPFGRLADPSPDGYAWAWLAAATHLAAAERSLVAASWTAAPIGAPPAVQ